jgi:hypothetical protein
MVDPGPPPRPSPKQGWKAFAWIGGGCLLAVLVVIQVLLLLSWGSRKMAGEVKKSYDARKEHPVLPPWVPVYPGTHAKGLVLHGEGEVTLRTQDPPDRVLDFYADRLRADGFEVERQTETTQVFRLHARRPDGSDVRIRSGQGFGRTWIALGFKTAGAQGWKSKEP